MQSGTTGINAIRIYNPIKQGLDHDPNGDFIRRWIPELSELPATQLHTPWQLGCTLPSAYPAPLVDYEAAARSARDQVWALRKGRTTSKRSSEAQGQLSLDLG
jgi:deoxyribodipyrimidine photo-lyase